MAKQCKSSFERINLYFFLIFFSVRLLLLFFFHVLRLPELQVVFKKNMRKSYRVNNSRFFRLVFELFRLFPKILLPIVIRTRFFHDKRNESRFNKLLDRFRFENFYRLFLLRSVELSRILVEIKKKKEIEG